MFSFTKTATGGDQAYFLAHDEHSRLYFVDVPDPKTLDSGNVNLFLFSSEIFLIHHLFIVALLKSLPAISMPASAGRLSREEELLMERQRMTGKGLTSYQVSEEYDFAPMVIIIDSFFLVAL